MANTRKRPAKPAAKTGSAATRLVARTPVAEWVAAGLGLALTIGVVGFSLWEGITAGSSVPAIAIEAEPPVAVAGGYLVAVTLRNDSDATASSISIRGELEREGRTVETRRAMFDYAPGKGEVRGGLVFQNDPAAHVLRLSVEGYQEP